MPCFEPGFEDLILNQAPKMLCDEICYPGYHEPMAHLQKAGHARKLNRDRPPTPRMLKS